MLNRSLSQKKLFAENNKQLDPWNWVWQSHEGDRPEDAEEISLADAVHWLHVERLCRIIPVAVIGPREPEAYQMDVALELGEALATLGLTVLCGGKGGVMEATAKGVHNKGGMTIGLVPDENWTMCNPYIDIPLATGIGPARNALITRAALALVAVGGQYGTISEVAYGLQFGKPVFGLAGAPDIEGAQQMERVEDVVSALLPILLRLEQLS
ncbi:TIGR00725 family protein [Rhodobacteraceae bacterium RKSG542]|uniref:TIGR00725 family protein n=1 Tax=Pseudovibrio flavus TaxID=2529854 RepID=UPI0012BC6FD7|nr:TIGR00725 family protein [Pseudovibrio flavus]MTI15952.1 TIGR00725 family protein [Pseudovibrio flavus]